MEPSGFMTVFELDAPLPQVQVRYPILQPLPHLPVSVSALPSPEVQGRAVARIVLVNSTTSNRLGP